MRATDSTKGWDELVWFHRTIAERWLQRGRGSGDPFAKFFFYFSGFNALYFLWKTIDGLSGGESRQIENLIKKFSPSEAKEILRGLAPSVNYFSERRPVQRMDERSSQSQLTGTQKEGRKWQKILIEEGRPLEQLNALGQIIYIVRSNLVHGSKAESGDDEEVIKSSLAPLEELLTRGISLSQRLN